MKIRMGAVSCGGGLFDKPALYIEADGAWYEVVCKGIHATSATLFSVKGDEPDGSWENLPFFLNQLASDELREVREKLGRLTLNFI